MLHNFYKQRNRGTRDINKINLLELSLHCFQPVDMLVE